VSEVRDLLIATAHAVFGREEGVEEAIEASGLSGLGSGGENDLGDVAAVIRVAAYNASGTAFAEQVMPAVVDERHRGALLRSIQMAGCLERVRDLTVRYSRERQQFGQVLHRFQAIQQQLAALAGLAALADAAVNDALFNPTPERIAVAKVVCGRAAGGGAAIAHQVHGAVGFTHQHPQHRFTTLLWRWRDEHGTEAEWARTLAEDLAAHAGSLWEVLVGA
jgi:alkylation response protein AidB-like acyl-CoA dehydrogenase